MAIRHEVSSNEVWKKLQPFSYQKVKCDNGTDVMIDVNDMTDSNIYRYSKNKKVALPEKEV